MNNNSSSKDDAIAKFREYCDFDDICSKVIIDVISPFVNVLRLPHKAGPNEFRSSFNPSAPMP